MKIVPFQPEHIERLRERGLQSEQARYEPILENPDYGVGLKNGGDAFSAIDSHGEIVACAGVLKQWANRGVAWSIVARNLGAEFYGVHMAVRRFLVECPINRIEAYVDCQFKEGHRWMELLGFKPECWVMRSFAPDGRDCSLYAMVKR
ncbi:MAG: hypothetical protein WAU89_23355 [Candidatus Acidiferrales bacterium]